MPEKTKYYKLGGQASNFWDPLQSKTENKSLSNRMVKELDVTKNVTNGLRTQWLLPATKEEFDAYKKEVRQVKKTLGGAAVRVADESAALKKANKMATDANESAATAKAEAVEATEKLVTVEEEAAKLKEENTELAAKLEAATKQ